MHAREKAGDTCFRPPVATKGWTHTWFRPESEVLRRVTNALFLR
jgi:hypothetical protein